MSSWDDADELDDEKEGWKYQNEAMTLARSGADWRLVNITFENAQTCFREISDWNTQGRARAATYLEQARVLDDIYHEFGQAKVAYEMAMGHAPAGQESKYQTELDAFLRRRGLKP